MRYLLLFIISSVFLFAEIAKISAVVGDAKIIRDNKNIVVKLGTLIEEKDIIETKKNSKVQIIFKDNTVVTLGKNSALNINEYLFDLKNPKRSKTDLNFFKGAFKTITGKIGKINKEKFKLRTKNSTIGIRGTVILANQRTVVCLSGEISVASGTQQVIVPQNNLTSVKNDGTLSTPTAYTQETLQSLSNSLEPDNSESSSTNNEESSNSSSSSSSSENSSSTSEGEEEKEANSENENSSSSNNSSEDESNISQEDSSVATSGDDTNSSDTPSSSASSTTASSSSDSITQVAQDAVDDEDNKTTEPEVLALSLEGYALGSYIDTANTTNSFYQDDSTFKAKRVDNEVSFEETFSRKYSGSTNGENINISKSKTFTLSKPTSGGYTGNSRLGTIDFSYTSNGGVTNSGSYVVQADNMGEFFVLYHDGSLTGTQEFNEILVFGNKGDYKKADKTKIYVYKDFASMQVERDSSSNLTKTKLDTTENGYEYFNPYLNSMTHVNSDYYKQGAEEFIVGTNDKIKVFRNKYNFTYNSGTTTPLNMSTYNYGTNTANIAFIGTDLQGISFNLESSNTTKTFSTNNETTTTSLNTGASFLEKDLMTTVKNSGTLTQTGFIVAEAYQNINNTDTFRKTSSDFTVQIDRSNGNITGDSTIGTNSGSSANGMTLKFNGEVDANTSYYINDDIFGVMFDKGDSNYKLGTDEYDLSDDSGYLIAVPDGALQNGSFKFFDSNDNPLMSDDDSSWGYWTAKFDASTNNAFVSPYSTWVAGIKTPDSVINPLINGGSITSYTFEGGVIGTVLTSSGNVETIIADGTATNIAKMTFDLGGGTGSMKNAVMGFSTTNSQWDLTMTGNTVNKDGFSGNLTGSGNGTFEGKFYGQDSIKSVGGSFSVTKQNASTGVVDAAAQGVFKAIKK